MNIQFGRIFLFSGPYLNDIKNTDGHNGFAGIYGDVSTTEKPGGFWDQLLLAYGRGERHKRPVIVGELDYHGKGTREINQIQTVVQADSFTREKIFSGIISGKSYAISKQGTRQLALNDAFLVQPGSSNRAGLGEVLSVIPGGNIELQLTGKTDGLAENTPNPGEITMVINGREIARKRLDLSNFKLQEILPLPKDDLQLHFFRFQLTSKLGGRLLANPIFFTIGGKK